MIEKREEHDKVRLLAFERGSKYEYQRICRVFVVIDDSMIIVIKGDRSYLQILDKMLDYE